MAAASHAHSYGTREKTPAGGSSWPCGTRQHAVFLSSCTAALCGCNPKQIMQIGGFAGAHRVMRISFTHSGLLASSSGCSSRFVISSAAAWTRGHSCAARQQPAHGCQAPQVISLRGRSHYLGLVGNSRELRLAHAAAAVAEEVDEHGIREDFSHPQPCTHSHSARQMALSFHSQCTFESGRDTNSLQNSYKM